MVTYVPGMARHPSHGLSDIASIDPSATRSTFDSSKVAYVAAHNSTIVPPGCTALRLRRRRDRRRVEINDALSMMQGRDRVSFSTGTSTAPDGSRVPGHTRLSGQGSTKTTDRGAAEIGRIRIPAGHPEPAGRHGRGLLALRERLRDGHHEPRPGPGHRRDKLGSTPTALCMHRHRATGCSSSGRRTDGPPGHRVLQLQGDRLPHARVQHEPAVGSSGGPDYAGEDDRVGSVRGMPGDTDAASESLPDRARSGSPASTSTSGRTSGTCGSIDCWAENNWESGFHLEPGGRYDENGEIIGARTISEDIHFINCTSTGNGQRNTYAATSSCPATTSRATRTSRTATP